MNKVKLKIYSLIKSKRGELLIETMASIAIFAILFSAISLNVISSITKIDRTVRDDNAYDQMIVDMDQEVGGMSLYYGIRGIPARMTFTVANPAAPGTNIVVDVRQFNTNSVFDPSNVNEFNIVSFRPN